MKKGIVILFFLSISILAKSQTLFSYGNNTVSKTEFETAYNKNNTSKSKDAKAIREYLDLYIAFKLKVQAAKDLQLDALPELQADLENFKSQIEEKYLQDGKLVQKIIEEAYERSQKDIHLIDYFISVPKNTDTSIYFKAANLLWEQLKNNQYKEGRLYKENNVQEIKTDVGCITAFTLPYEFETIIYNLKPGTFSHPVRTTDGWHIFHHAGERKAVGQIKVAQILLSAPKELPKERMQAKALADSIYTLLLNGADFNKLVTEFSDDRSTSFNEGILPAFGVGKYEKTFEQKAFSLKKDGDILAPFETEFGYHILRKISSEPIPDWNSDGFYREEITQKVLNDSRMDAAKKAFSNQVEKMTGPEQKKFDQKALWEITDSSLFANRIIRVGNMSEETILFTFNDKSGVTVSDWTLYLRNSGAFYHNQLKKTYPELYSEFIQHASLNNYKKNLAKFNPEFNAQLQEFTDGNMLFEVMEREVWSKAANDSTGLLAYYNQNKNKYKWAESADALIISCMNETIANRVLEDFKNEKSKETILLENESLVQIDSARYELPQIPVNSEETISGQKITQPVHNEQDGTVVFAKILKVYPANEIRSFDEARGMVISDYQRVIEEKWLADLYKKYPVKINDKTLKNVMK
ncbi:MAG: peptidylprolyl isomerase [Ginsengibacter sp.]